MTREEILKEIERLEKIKFMHEMQDRWTQEDFDFNREITVKIQNLKKILDK